MITIMQSLKHLALVVSAAAVIGVGVATAEAVAEGFGLGPELVQSGSLACHAGTCLDLASQDVQDLWAPTPESAEGSMLHGVFSDGEVLTVPHPGLGGTNDPFTPRSVG
jgi:hypothetical protein